MAFMGIQSGWVVLHVMFPKMYKGRDGGWMDGWMGNGVIHSYPSLISKQQWVREQAQHWSQFGKDWPFQGLH